MRKPIFQTFDDDFIRSMSYKRKEDPLDLTGLPRSNRHCLHALKEKSH